jgi:hypothetical protein
MAEQPSPEPTEIARVGDARLPIPAPDRRRVVASRAGATDLTRLTARTLATGPAIAVTVLGAAAAAAVTGAAVAARLLWPWATAGRPNLVGPSQQPTSSSGSIGPSVYVRYTSVEIHWPGQL